jgi:hypothetical protein
MKSASGEVIAIAHARYRATGRAVATHFLVREAGHRDDETASAALDTAVQHGP